MNIGFYTLNYPGITGEGVIGTYTRHLALALSSLGHQVHVLTRELGLRQAKDGPVTGIARAGVGRALDGTGNVAASHVGLGCRGTFSLSPFPWSWD